MRLKEIPRPITHIFTAAVIGAIAASSRPPENSSVPPTAKQPFSLVHLPSSAAERNSAPLRVMTTEEEFAQKAQEALRTQPDTHELNEFISPWGQISLHESTVNTAYARIYHTLFLMEKSQNSTFNQIAGVLAKPFAEGKIRIAVLQRTRGYYEPPQIHIEPLIKEEDPLFLQTEIFSEDILRCENPISLAFVLIRYGVVLDHIEQQIRTIASSAPSRERGNVRIRAWIRDYMNSEYRYNLQVRNIEAMAVEDFRQDSAIAKIADVNR